MPAITVSTAIFLGIQAIIVRFVYREAATQSRFSPLLAAICSLVVAIGAVFLLNSLLVVLLIQAIAIGLYRLGGARTTPAPQ
ncbi:hypothetical protein halTADL_1726 [Halohasta litchfieldiae]|jgi:uncharacterized membrane protein YdfJ with MMPL/SSD domain|uniref:Sporulation control protein n=1 Tax=Halohasta litchfieldiae TaxID=1073996 RepID=A0A1H6R2C8_9EURY|nr:sporulation control protein [Halohasta litchfieldiae]ATW88480.1 hypothetical protein halTADL_1726 [Halohasta litchfieldiae]SEI49943.1 hypothetical protein SAMN05444271_101239 [Halohasta litchfieldiae]